MAEENKEGKKRCPDCGGKGYHTVSVQGDPFMEDCEKCGGSGKIKA